MHLIIDGYGGDPQRLDDEGLVAAILDSYPGAIGMTKIAPPSVHRYDGPVFEDRGVSGFVLIAESHISIHTFPERRMVWVDLFSCKAFDAERAADYIREQFSLTEMKIRLLEDRSLEPAHHPPAHV